jgi:DNA mismatch endonuclease (patch repair protein)
MYPKIAGNPDFLVGRKTVVFCDSSFWHGRNWPVLRERLRRGSNSGYWIRHIMKNRARDQKVTRELIGDGYTVVRLWDTQILKDTQYCMRVIRGLLNEPSTIKRKIQDDNLSNNDR